jgi:hypothetical protein
MKKHTVSNESNIEGLTDNSPVTEVNCDPAADASSSSACTDHQGREDYFMDIDRMVNEGLGGGNVTLSNGLIEETTTDTMNNPESVIDHEDET